MFSAPPFLQPAANATAILLACHSKNSEGIACLMLSRYFSACLNSSRRKNDGVVKKHEPKRKDGRGGSALMLKSCFECLHEQLAGSSLRLAGLVFVLAPSVLLVFHSHGSTEGCSREGDCVCVCGPASAMPV